MKTGLKGSLVLGFFLTGSAVAGSAAEVSPAITIRVSNQAEVDLMTLVQAEKTATGIFKKTGVESRWIEPAAEGSFPLSHIQLKILPSVMSLRSGLPDKFPDNAMGLAPGSGPDRQSAYVFYDSVEAVATKHIADTYANTAQILGHAIAHEIGHLLLNVQTHSAAGIMRGAWNLRDLQNAGYGYLFFTPQQAKAIRDDVGRRVRQSQERRYGPDAPWFFLASGLRDQWFDANDCAAVLIPHPQARERSGLLHLHVANVGFMRQ